MASEFDPYYTWLKIPPSEQPPNHYRLLGTARFESDPELIESSVAKLVTRLQQLSGGPNVADAQRILNDVAKARLCLIDPNKKAAYDAQLKAQLELARKAVSQSTKTTAADSNGASATPIKRSTNAPNTKNSSVNNRNKSAARKPVQKTNSLSKSKSTAAVKGQRDKVNWALLIGAATIAAMASGIAVFAGLQYLTRQPEHVVTDNAVIPSTATESNQAAQIAKSDHVLNPNKKPGPNQAAVQKKFDPASSLQTESESKTQPTPDFNPISTATPAAKSTEPATIASSTLSGSASDANTALESMPIPIPDPNSIADSTPLADGNMTADSGSLLAKTSDYSPEQFDELREIMESKTVATVKGTVVQFRESNSGKTLYLHFSNDWDDTVMVFMNRDRDTQEFPFSKEALQAMVGKTIRVSTDIDEEFGSKRLGLKVVADHQIEVVE